MTLDDFMAEVERIADREDQSIAIIYADGMWQAAVGSDFFSAFEKDTYYQGTAIGEVERLWRETESEP